MKYSQQEKENEKVYEQCLSLKIELQKKKATLELEKGSAIFIKISKKGTVSLKRELNV